MNDLESVDEEEMLKIAIAMSLQEEEEEELVFNKGIAPKDIGLIDYNSKC